MRPHTSPSVIILPGWEHGGDSWEALSKRIEGSHIIELPGFGNEPLVSEEWGVPEYANWVENKVRASGTRHVVLLGHSFGGRVAAFIASKQPEWLHGLILYAAPCIYRPSSYTRFKILLARVLKSTGTAPLFFAFRTQELKRAEERGMSAIFRRVVNFDQTEILPHIQVSTLLVWGSRDDSVPLQIARETQTLIAKSKLSILPDLGHNAHIENPNLFYGTIKHFLENQ